VGCAVRRALGAAPASASVRARSPPPRGQCSGPPSRLPSLERESIFVPHRTAAAYPPADRRLTPDARAYRGRRRAGELRRRVPSPRPPIKAMHRPARARPLHAGSLSVRPLPRTPSSGLFCRSPVLPRSSTRPPQPPHAARAPTQTGRPPEQGAPRPGSLGAAGRPTTGAPPPSAGTNPQRVSPSSFSTPSPAEPATGVAQFRRVAPPSIPRDYIASLSLIPGCFS
jgi:hypothetical protein